MQDDAELLRQYAAGHAEAAFAELVRRHVDLVYSAALRLVSGDLHRAQDVTQQVFTELARQTRSLTAHPALAGWLYTTTRQMSRRVNRTEQRRAAREQEAHTMNELLREQAPVEDWEQLRPVIEVAMHELREPDRLAVLLRFFQNKSLKETGAVLGLNENAARMRIERALDKLRVQLARKGVTSTSAALGLELAGHAVAAAPPAFVATLASASLAGAAAGGAPTLTFLKLVTMTKLQAGIVGALAVAGVATSLVLYQQSQAKQRAAETFRQQQGDQLAGLERENHRLASLTRQEDRPGREERDDLLRLRAEANALRQRTNAQAALQAADPTRGIREPQASESKTALELQEEGMAKMFFAKDWILAFLLYASKHGDRFPTNFDQAVSFFPGGPGKHPTVSTEQFDFIYQDSTTSVTNGSALVVLREKQAWRSPAGKWLKTYGFADGHSELINSADGDFAAVEAKRGLIVGTLNQ